jgi:hypothetical protein
MSIKILTLLNKIDSMASKENVSIIMDLYNYMHLEIQMFGNALLHDSKNS